MEHTTQALVAAAGVVFAGAVTPGPNNFVILRQATRAGWPGAFRAGTGIVAGSLALVLLAAAGLGPAVAAEPRLARWLAAAGSLYLLALGVGLLVRRAETAAEGATPDPTAPDRLPAGDHLPAGAAGLFFFQLVNPKAWLLTLAVTALLQARLGAGAALLPLAVLFTVVPAVCLALWSGAGIALAHRLRRPGARRLFDRVTGALLAGSALLLLVSTWKGP